MNQLTKAIIFDMDGVMFDTERLYEEAFLSVAKQWGYESDVTLEFVKSFKGQKKESIKKLYKTLLDEKSIQKTGKGFDADEHMKQVLEYLDGYIERNGMPVKHGLIELIKYAHINNIKVAIGTSEKLERVKYYLEKADIGIDLFDAIVCGNMVEHGKPAPDIYLKVCEKLSVNPEDAIVCEDAPNGIMASYNAGTKTIMIVDLIEPTEEIKKLLFWEPLKSLSQLQDILDKNK